MRRGRTYNTVAKIKARQHANAHMRVKLYGGRAVEFAKAGEAEAASYDAKLAASAAHEVRRRASRRGRLPPEIMAAKREALEQIHKNLAQPLSQQEPDPRVRLVGRHLPSDGGDVQVRSYTRRRPS